MNFLNKDKKERVIFDISSPQKRKQYDNGLPDVTISSLEYKGGHPKMTKEKDCKLVIQNDSLTMKCGFDSVSIDYKNVNGIHFETQEQLGRRITITRLLTLNVFALALQKKTKDTARYLTIDISYKGIENTVVIGGKKVGEAHSKLIERYSKYLDRHPSKRKSNESVIINTIEHKVDPYEELKKLKELLEMGIISQEEFDLKKKKILGI